MRHRLCCAFHLSMPYAKNVTTVMIAKYIRIKCFISVISLPFGNIPDGAKVHFLLSQHFRFFCFAPEGLIRETNRFPYRAFVPAGTFSPSICHPFVVHSLSIHHIFISLSSSHRFIVSSFHRLIVSSSNFVPLPPEINHPRKTVSRCHAEISQLCAPRRHPVSADIP